MVNYRRNKIKGGVYFFTVTLRDRNSMLLTEYVKLLGECMRRVRAENAYETNAIVVLPEHLHAIWALPEEDEDYAMRWRKIKSYFTKELINRKVRLNNNKHREYDLWQRRYWEHTIRDEQDYINHFNYIHYNPVKHGYVKSALQWKYSSIHRYVKKGLLPPNWGEEEMKFGNSFGE